MAYNINGHLITSALDTKLMYVKTVPVNRTFTAGQAVAMLPQGSRIISFILNGIPSNASLTATLAIGTTPLGVDLVPAHDVTSVGAPSTVILPAVAGAIGTPTTNPNTTVYVTYAETGTASTQGLWELTIQYSLAN